jgi:hypothetical protein
MLPHVDYQADSPFAHRISWLQAGEKIWFTVNDLISNPNQMYHQLGDADVPIYTDILVL